MWKDSKLENLTDPFHTKEQTLFELDNLEVKTKKIEWVNKKTIYKTQENIKGSVKMVLMLPETFPTKNENCSIGTNVKKPKTRKIEIEEEGIRR